MTYPDAAMLKKPPASRRAKRRRLLPLALIALAGMTLSGCDNFGFGKSGWGFERKRADLRSLRTVGDYGKRGAIRNYRSSSQRMIFVDAELTGARREREWVFSSDYLDGSFSPKFREFLKEKSFLDKDDNRPLRAIAAYANYQTYWISLFSGSQARITPFDHFRKRRAEKYTCEFAKGYRNQTVRAQSDQSGGPSYVSSSNAVAPFANQAGWVESGGRYEVRYELDFGKRVYRQTVDGAQIFFGSAVRDGFGGHDDFYCLEQRQVPAGLIEAYKGEYESIAAFVCTKSLDPATGRALIYHDADGYLSALQRPGTSAGQTLRIDLDVGYCTRDTKR